MGSVVRIGAVLAVLWASAASAAAGPLAGPLPLNDLQPLVGLTGGVTPAFAGVQQNPEPPLKASPRAICGRGSRPLDGVQGRVPAEAINSPAAAKGWTCNVSPIGRYATPGGFRVWRYVDQAGHECAFYDTSLDSPLSAVRIAFGGSPGVQVLDMSDPRKPLPTALLTELPMRAPHESLNLNARRGLLAAEMGNGTTYPGVMALYDVSRDCRQPELQWTGHASRTGHESGWAPDGTTFWIAGGEGIAAVDVSDPRHPRTLWEGNLYAHGLKLRADGKRLYVSDPINGHLVILDVSEVQERRPVPVVREISRLTWDTVSVPQNTAPMTIRGKPYLLEFDEFAFRFSAVSKADTVGAARIIDISDERRPRVVSNLRLQVNQPAEHAAANGDPSPMPVPAFTYSAHYCAVPRAVNPQIVACSFINSGLRIFDIRNPLRPREVAYYVAPMKPGDPAAANFAMSQPAFVPKRREVWYTDAYSGFHVLRLAKRVWPNPTKR